MLVDEKGLQHRRHEQYREHAAHRLGSEEYAGDERCRRLRQQHRRLDDDEDVEPSIRKPHHDQRRERLQSENDRGDARIGGAGHRVVDGHEASRHGSEQ